LYFLSPVRGNAFHVSFAVNHVGQRPTGVPLALGTPAGRLSAPRITLRQSSRELISQPREMVKNFKLALAQARGHWGAWLFPNLVAILLQEYQ
jgi:hypothetical protein